MIIIVRGNHGAGKSTVVRKIKQQAQALPIYGLLGPRNPEAYSCMIDKFPFYILGPYEQPTTAGCDYVTKKGVAATLQFLDKYVGKGRDIVLESIQLSARYSAPTIGKWLEDHRSDVVAFTLTTTLQECADAISARQQKSIKGVPSEPPIHLKAQQRMFELVTAKLLGNGFRVEYVSRDDAVTAVLNTIMRKRG